jgi:hypothetical protein
MAIQPLSELFKQMQLQTNTTKTEVGICTPSYISDRMSDTAAHKCRMDRTGEQSPGMAMMVDQLFPLWRSKLLITSHARTAW